jgi:hypothetical protein
MDSDANMEVVTFEEILFFRIAFEFTKMYRSDRSVEFQEHLEQLTVSFDDYNQIFTYLLT